jgi:hypothetical protein
MEYQTHEGLMKTFIAPRRVGVRNHLGRMDYILEGKEYKIDGRRKGYFGKSEMVISQDLYEKYFNIESPAIEVEEIPNQEEEE